MFHCRIMGACAAFFEAEKEEVNFHLGRLCKQLRLTRAMQKMHHVRKARVPIVKVPSSYHVMAHLPTSEDACLNNS